MTQDTGHRTPDTGHRTQDTGHRTPGGPSSQLSSIATLALTARSRPKLTISIPRLLHHNTKGPELTKTAKTAIAINEIFF